MYMTQDIKYTKYMTRYSEKKTTKFKLSCVNLKVYSVYWQDLYSKIVQTQHCLYSIFKKFNSFIYLFFYLSIFCVYVIIINLNMWSLNRNYEESLKLMQQAVTPPARRTDYHDTVSHISSHFFWKLRQRGLTAVYQLNSLECNYCLLYCLFLSNYSNYLFYR